MVWCQNRPISRGGLAAAIVAVSAAAGFSPARAGEGDDYQKFLAEKAPALVTIKFVLKVSMGGMMAGMGDQENETEITAVMIDPKGIALCSNTQLGGFTGIMQRMMGAMGGEITATPTDLKVLIGDDTEGVDAELIARDSELDLAWVRIKEPGDKKFAFADLSNAAKPKMGQRLLTVRRMGKYYARIAVVGEGRIGGVTKKPRDLYVPTGDIGAALGLPVYTESGQIVGVAIMQMPDAEDTEMNPAAIFSQLGNMQEMMSGLILPAADVAKATRRALESVDEKKK